jgi:hypothetical protein
MVGQSKQDQAEVIHTVGCTLTTIISMLKGIKYYPLLRASGKHIPCRYGKMEMSNSYEMFSTFKSFRRAYAISGTILLRRRLNHDVR